MSSKQNQLPHNWYDEELKYQDHLVEQHQRLEKIKTEYPPSTTPIVENPDIGSDAWWQMMKRKYPAYRWPF